jgi:hypothetical protein
VQGRRGATVCSMLVRRIVLGAVATAAVSVVVAFAVPASSSATAPHTSSSAATTPQAQSGPSLQTLESRYFEVAPPNVVIAANSG